VQCIRELLAWLKAVMSRRNQLLGSMKPIDGNSDRKAVQLESSSRRQKKIESDEESQESDEDSRAVERLGSSNRMTKELPKATTTRTGDVTPRMTELKDSVSVDDENDEDSDDDGSDTEPTTTSDMPSRVPNVPSDDSESEQYRDASVDTRSLVKPKKATSAPRTPTFHPSHTVIVGKKPRKEKGLKGLKGQILSKFRSKEPALMMDDDEDIIPPKVISKSRENPDQEEVPELPVAKPRKKKLPKQSLGRRLLEKTINWGNEVVDTS